MKVKDIIQKNLVFYARYFKLVGLAILISVAVIVGSLVIGDSVRSSLINRVNERLGDTQTVVFAHQSFLNNDFCEDSIFGSSARGILLTNGFISVNGSLLPVMVWGVNDMEISNGSAKVNEALYQELNFQPGNAIVLRLPAQGLVPSGSLFVTENYTTSLRLELSTIVNAEHGGNISLKNEQTLPLNIFVSREELAETMGVHGKINLILSDLNVTSADIEKKWNYSISGLSISQHHNFKEITSDRVFLQKEVLANIQHNNSSINRIYSYLANSIDLNKSSIPYSFVSAVDQYQNEKLKRDEVILSDYTAKRLNANVGDQVNISFYISQDFKTLQSDSVLLRVKKIVPLSELRSDSTLSADFPGISDVDRCTEWDSDLPINMDLITPEDEHYWEMYNSTPKAILPYEAIANKWGNDYGYATAIRVYDSAANLKSLTPDMFGVQTFHPRESGIYAAKNGVDFAGLFMSLGFFIIISAMLLMIIPVSEMMIQRKSELQLLNALGYTPQKLKKMIWLESAPVVLVSSIMGVIAGVIYTAVIMWLLGTYWKGATHTEGFSVYPHWITLIAGLLTGILISLFILRRVIAKNINEKTRKIKAHTQKLKRKKGLVIIVSSLTVLIALYNLIIATSLALFSVVGLLLMITFALLGDYIICSKGKTSTHQFNDEKMIFRTLLANRKQALLSYFSLAFGVFIVFSVGLNRQDFSNSSKLENATGGYTLWCESSIPVYHNINTISGREKLNLQDLQDETQILQCLKYSADEASCLNLNKVSTPSVLGVDLKSLLSGPMQVQNNIYDLKGDDLHNQLKVENNKVIPALVDATVLQWSLGKTLGDTIYYTGSDGQEYPVLLAGTLPNTIFQGYILVDQSLFSKVWETTKGSELFLLNTEPDHLQEVKTLVSQALHEYGVRVTTTNDRLKQFNTVTDTYLTIFLTLGGIGLLLGIFGFIIVIRKNLSIRQKEIELYSTLGFLGFKIKDILYRENRIVPLYAIATGLFSALIGIGTNFKNVQASVWITAIFFAFLFVLLTILFVKRIVKKEIEKGLMDKG
ncbi:ABC transporter permease [Plebeiibacterium sediminum]|uniref:ABC transporter permease n=1 Tax=Plebeiibacterium sediminum TaxID=2992112 RepID=A0AAE3M103_9BACT|nr:ABC transporter permease [Plebeiobacterium sediminum]MCW3785276.1 ABC transporter permease [Plebeiobacterium sediminum]